MIQQRNASEYAGERMKYIEISAHELRQDYSPKFLWSCWQRFILRYPSVAWNENLIMMHRSELDKLRIAIEVLIKECIEHNAEYHHITPKELLDKSRDLVKKID